MKTSGKKLPELLCFRVPFSRMYLPFVLVLFALLLSGSAFTYYPPSQQDENLRITKLDILERLESGKSVTAEQIRSSFEDHDYTDNNNLSGLQDIHEFQAFYDLPDIPDLPEMPALPEIPSLPDFSFDFSFYGVSDSDNVFNREDLEYLKENLSRDVAEMKRNLEALSNSHEYVEFREEMRKFSEELRREMEQWRNEFRQAAREERSRQIM